MKVHEYQAKTLLSEFGIPVPDGQVAATLTEARKIASEFGGNVAIKAQVYAGGRGKAGGIKVASTPDEAEKLAYRYLLAKLPEYKLLLLFFVNTVDGNHLSASKRDGAR